MKRFRDAVGVKHGHLYGVLAQELENAIIRHMPTLDKSYQSTNTHAQEIKIPKKKGVYKLEEEIIEFLKPQYNDNVPSIIPEYELITAINHLRGYDKKRTVDKWIGCLIFHTLIEKVGKEKYEIISLREGKLSKSEKELKQQQQQPTVQQQSIKQKQIEEEANSILKRFK